MNTDEQKFYIYFFIFAVIVILVFFKQVWLAIFIVICVLLNLITKQVKNHKTSKELNQSIEAFPYNAKLYNERAYFNIQHMKYKSALDDYNKVIELNSHNPAESLANRAYVYYLMKEYQLAIKEYNKAIEYQPQCPTWYYYRAMAYIGCENKNSYIEAIIDLNTAYELQYNTKNSILYNINSKNFSFYREDINYSRGLLYSWLDKPYCAIEELKIIPPKYHSSDIAKSELNKCEEKFRQIKEIEKLAQIDYWSNLNGWEYEEAIAKVFENLGYNTKVTKGSGDGGVDIIIKKNDYLGIIQCKHYNTPVPPEPVRALWGCKDEFGASEVILVASNGVTQSGQEFINKRPNFKLYTLKDILNLAASKDTSNSEFITEIQWYSKKEAQNTPNLNINLPLRVNKNASNSYVSIEYCAWEKDENNNYKTKVKTLTVKIPSDFQYGQKLRCREEANIDCSKDKKGDLYLILSEEKTEMLNVSEDIAIPTNVSQEKQEIDTEKELRKFNWGAFLLPALWLLENNCQEILGLCLLIGFILDFLYKAGLSDNTGIILYIGLSIYLGIKGNKIAWSKNKNDSFEIFKGLQKLWLIINSVIFTIIAILIVICQILK